MALLKDYEGLKTENYDLKLLSNIYNKAKITFQYIKMIKLACF